MPRAFRAMSAACTPVPEGEDVEAIEATEGDDDVVALEPEPVPRQGIQRTRVSLGSMESV